MTNNWDEMTPEQQARARAFRQRTHGSVAGEIRLALEDARAGAFGEAVDWLAANGFADASVQLEAACFPLAAAE